MIRWGLPLCLVALLASYIAAAAPQGGKLVVVATIPPLAALAKAVGGDRVEVVYIVPGASDPHQYAPTPRDVELASSCDLFIEVGKEPFLKSLPAERGRERITWGDWVSAGLKVEGGNPHYIWLYPPNAVKAVGLIAEKLAELDPAGAREYARRAEAFSESIEELVEWCRSYIRAHGVEGATVVAVGSHFIPLLEFFGFKVVGPLMVGEGRSPSPSSLSSLVEEAKRAGAKVVVVLATQREADEGRVGRQIADELGVGVVYLHGIQFSGGDEYCEYIKYTLAALVAALEASSGAAGGNGLWPLLILALSIAVVAEAGLLARGWWRGGGRA
ncbi:MAG: hypothetical protein DRJ67_08675 [Thermoprotei archaeon]|nr:MAG: hypothetical protein DRJ67_08675 [Thermoprotei archaeon]